MDKQDMLRKMRAGKFVENNGYVLRTINILRHKYERLKDVKYVLIPGYVFVQVEYTDKLYYALKGTQGVIKLLCTDNRPSPLSAQEEAWIQSWEQPLLPSKIQFNSEGYEIIDGPLSQENIKVLKIDRHRRRAKVEISILGSPKIAYLSLDVLKGV